MAACYVQPTDGTCTVCFLFPAPRKTVSVCQFLVLLVFFSNKIQTDTRAEDNPDESA